MKYLRIIENNLVVIFFLLGVITNLIGIALRFFPSIPQYWVPETYTLLFLIAIFIGFGTALRDGKHITVDLANRFTSKTVQSAMMLLSYLLSLAFGVLFMVSGYFIVVKTFKQGLTTPDIGLPVWITYLIMPITGILILIHLINFIVKHFRKEEF
ncbi:hypothetical protein JNUCC1_00953 [Lentibacillus sp. JNUCC-1]|uniref:TRAP transporter small permease n=1 Tax=Lentibacillus sp. JNUCC-1 TaxID=2654513 RepID=UPI0012E89095|nr:TRAP transporter small permease [Lentibacillus sp. JNUCC-1]MUV37147.1 hypothetical protein [Lentibacillus sp. JNUCC-1]